ncbi:MAG: hypothetical protein HY363_01090 [Candidatus Aenigmarchaeota archaeon]|nr:hypothetical protein [Candidatus Aenigmarchaeota archaeon]
MSKPNPLLIKRDSTVLGSLEGKVDVDKDVPEPLKTGCYVVNAELVNDLVFRAADDDLVTAGRNDVREIVPEMECYIDHIHAVWSGHRSVLVQTKKNEQKLYKLKGISFNSSKPVVEHYNNGTHEIWGGQPAYSAEFERKMSNRFNAVLENEGITPVMKHKGFWRYSTRAGKEKLTASVVEVQGDTRLDELLFVLDNWLWLRTEGKRVNYGGEILYSNLRGLAHEIGYVSGQLKQLMDKNNQTWSSGVLRSNAHIGNIVVYRDNDALKVGLVDFDASCDTNDFTLSEIKDLQKKENELLCQSALKKPISLRYIGYLTRIKTIILSETREQFVIGFILGYNSSLKTLRAIDAKLFLRIVEDLRSGINLTAEPTQVSIHYHITEGLETK